MNIMNVPILFKGPPDSGRVAITFDDGPHATASPALLDILESHHARATFFVTGANAAKNIDIVKRMVREGHTVGNHSFSHKRALFQSRTSLSNEIKRTNDLIEQVSGRPNRFFRPPYGIISPTLLSICRTLDLRIVMWSFNSKDYRQPKPQTIVGRAARKLHSGAILLLHDGHFARQHIAYHATALSLESVLNTIAQKHLKTATIESMFGSMFESESEGV
jgi:peptidoglycan/xylan/chitin deacetylase (PgdA/CDA1 family)